MAQSEAECRTSSPSTRAPLAAVRPTEAHRRASLEQRSMAPQPRVSATLLPAGLSGEPASKAWRRPLVGGAVHPRQRCSRMLPTHESVARGSDLIATEVDRYRPWPAALAWARRSASTAFAYSCRRSSIPGSRLVCGISAAAVRQPCSLSRANDCFRATADAAPRADATGRSAVTGHRSTPLAIAAHDRPVAVRTQPRAAGRGANRCSRPGPAPASWHQRRPARSTIALHSEFASSVIRSG